MIFDDFEINAMPFFSSMNCKNCGESLKEVSDGWLSRAFYCPECENVYTLKIIKVSDKKITKKFLKQCREENSKPIEA